MVAGLGEMAVVVGAIPVGGTVVGLALSAAVDRAALKDAGVEGAEVTTAAGTAAEMEPMTPAGLLVVVTVAVMAVAPKRQPHTDKGIRQGGAVRMEWPCTSRRGHGSRT